MTLLQAEMNSLYLVKTVSMERNIESRLEVLGLTRGTRIKILNRKRNGSMIIRVRGTRLALGRTIADHISVVAIAQMEG